MTAKRTELVATWADGRATTYRLDAKAVRESIGHDSDPGFAMARRTYANALDKCAAVMDGCAAELRDTTPLVCLLCGNESPQNEPCTKCGATG